MYEDSEFKKAVIDKLDTLVKLVAISTKAQNLLGGNDQKDQIKILSELGLSRNIVALIVGTTPETVSVRLSEMKSKTSYKKIKKSGEMQEEVVPTNDE